MPCLVSVKSWNKQFCQFNFFLLVQFFAKEGLDIPKDYIEGTIHCKPGAAISLIEKAYTLLTHKT